MNNGVQNTSGLTSPTHHPVNGNQQSPGVNGGHHAMGLTGTPLLDPGTSHWPPTGQSNNVPSYINEDGGTSPNELRYKVDEYLPSYFGQVSLYIYIKIYVKMFLILFTSKVYIH